MKKIFFLLSVFVVQALLVILQMGCQNQKKSASEGSGDGKIVMWGFFEGMPKAALDHYAAVSGKEVAYQTIGWGDYTTKLNTVLGTKDAPDVMLLERSFMGQYMPLDKIMAVNELWNDKPEMQAYLKNSDPSITGQTNVNGKVKGIGWENTSGAFFYRSDMAKKYLGVNTVAEMEALISKKDKFITLMKDFEKKAPGVKFMSTNYMASVLLSLSGAYNVQPDGSYIITKEVAEAFKDVKEFYEMKNFYSPTYDKTAIMNGAKKDKFFSHMMPAWAIQDIKEWGQSGKWAIANPPIKYAMGGTFIAVSNTADKDLVWDFLASTFLNEKWILDNMSGFGMVANSKIMKEYLANSDAGGNEYFGGQNTIAKFAEISAGVDNVISATLYDSGLKKVTDDIINGLTIDATIKNENEAVNKLKQELATLYPDLKILNEQQVSMSDKK